MKSLFKGDPGRPEALGNLEAFLHNKSPMPVLMRSAVAHAQFETIHPFLDGNGRIARLIANLPLLKCGLPPLFISLERRAKYIDRLWEYENAVGIIRRDDRLLPYHQSIAPFKAMLREESRESLSIVNEARQMAAARI